MITPSAQRAIQKGLAFLASRQHDDGSFVSSTYGRNVAVVSLAGMAFMSSGSTPGRGPHGRHVNQCADYVLSHCQDDGYIIVSGAESHGPMYGHGFATLFLAEVFGMAMRSDLREKLSKAVRLIVETQNREGGWRYHPDTREADISVTVCQMMALRAAKNAGIAVPNETVDRCVDYVKRCQNSDGGFMYMLEGGPSAYPRSAAGVVALYNAGVYDAEEIRNGLAYLVRNAPRTDAYSRENHYYYGQYYAAQAMWQAGAEHWKKWFPTARDAILARQNDDGGWPDQIGIEYGTSMALIVLQTPNNNLPIFQR
jgi:prenyltransferase beta subunit